MFQFDQECRGGMRRRARNGRGRGGVLAVLPRADGEAAACETTALMIERDRLIARLAAIETELRARGAAAQDGEI